MSRVPNPTKALLDSFGVAPGQAADREWAGEAAWALSRANVASPVIRELLTSARDLVAHSQESCQDLFGPAEPWAHDQIEQLRAEGRPVASADPLVRWADVPVLAMVTATVLAALFLVIAVVKDSSPMDYTVGVVAFPVLAGLTVITTLATWESVLSRRQIWIALASAGGVVVAGVVLMVSLFALTAGRPFAQASPWHYALVVAACALLAAGFDRMLPDARPRSVTEPVSDDEWEQIAGGVLRLRADLPESRVRAILEEARTYAGESGATLQAEFGRPEDYAASIDPDLATGARRRALLYAVLSGLAGFMAVADGFSWAWMAVFVGFAALAADRWWSGRRRGT